VSNRTIRYAAACTALAMAGVLLCWPLLDGSGRIGTITAAALALPVQVGAFAALRWGWSRRNHFLAAWAAGMMARALLVGVGLVLVLVSDLPPAPTLLSLAAFLFGMLLIEPFFIAKDLHGAGRP
jgi:hypothetical protein